MATTLGSKGSDVFTYDGVGDPRVALSIILVRGLSELEIETGLKKILYYSDTTLPDYDKLHEDAYVLAFMTRNIRGGKGERDLSYKMFRVLYDEQYEIMTNLMDLIPHYGYWGDIFTIWEECKNPVLQMCLYNMVENQLKEDEAAVLADKSISLLAKWIPRQNRQKEIAQQIALAMFKEGNFSHRMMLYRKRISRLNKYLDTVEIDQCGKTWSNIKPASVPGRALAKYRSAFMNEKKGEGNINITRYPDVEDRVKCAEIFKEHMVKAAKGEAVVRAVDTVMVHEIYSRIIKNMHSSEEEKNLNRAQWRVIRENLKSKGTFSKMIAMADFSGSMDGTPKMVSAAMSIMISELATGCGKNKIMTFDSEPTWIEFPESDDIYTKTDIIGKTSLAQGTSTDFQKAMELIISDLKKNRTPVEDMATDLVVFTDMAWDAACNSSDVSYYTSNSYRHHVKTEPWQTHIEMIRESFKRAGEDMFGEGKGYTMPRIIIWNLRSSGHDDFHAKADTPGVLNYSGWSQSIFKYLVANGFTAQTPYQGLRQQLDDPSYDLVRLRYRKLKLH
jgi:hypothetical protein